MTSITALGEPGVHLIKDNISLYEDAKLIDRGSIVISESAVTWRGNSRQFSLSYPSICLHAGEHVWSTEEPEVHAGGDVEMADNETNHNAVGSGSSDSDENGDSDFVNDDEQPTAVLRFVPDDRRALDEMYTALADCQALNPDPDDFSESELDGLNEEEEEEEHEGAEVEAIEDGEIDPENFTDA
ncbi:Methylosome subunit pICln [Sparganum proliferum]